MWCLDLQTSVMVCIDEVSMVVSPAELLQK